MPKKTIVLKDFSLGLLFSSHGVDNPENSLSKAGNVDVNNKPGVITLSGAFQEMQMPEASTNVLEAFKTPYNFKGCRGRGLFYFTSE